MNGNPYFGCRVGLEVNILHETDGHGFGCYQFENVLWFGVGNIAIEGAREMRAAFLFDLRNFRIDVGRKRIVVLCRPYFHAGAVHAVP